MRTSSYDRTVQSAARRCLPIAAAGLCLVLAGPAVAQDAPTDHRITLAVERELIQDEAVPFDQLEVATTSGVVTLSGTLDNLLARDRAIHIAQAVKGVRSVVDEMQVMPVARSDGDLRFDVTKALSAHPATDSYELMVAVDEGVVTLTGTVDSWTERQLSEAVAKGVKGVKNVQNQITLEWKTDRPDAEIAEDVKSALRWDRLVDHGLIRTDVKDGVVTLSGKVGSAAERRRAAAASWVSGVRQVKSDDLEVALWTRHDDLRADKYVQPSDDEIAEAIEDALVFDARVMSTHVTPDVERGIVTLRGTVPTVDAREAAVAAARNTVGVWQVKDHLRVRSSAGIDDAALAAGIREALGRDPYVERFEVTVGVSHGVATLTGTVDQAFQKQRAEHVAGDTAGVVAVNNFLTVRDSASRMTYEPFADQRMPSDYNWFYPPPWAAKSDWEIAQDIRSELWWSPFVDADQITVTVKDGTATLTGRVSTWNERRVASENAIEGGAMSVDNRLEVTHGPDATTSSS